MIIQLFKGCFLCNKRQKALRAFSIHFYYSKHNIFSFRISVQRNKFTKYARSEFTYPFIKISNHIITEDYAINPPPPSPLLAYASVHPVLPKILIDFGGLKCKLPFFLQISLNGHSSTFGIQIPFL